MDEIEMQKRLKWYENNHGPYLEGDIKQRLFRWPTRDQWIILGLLLMLIIFGIVAQQNATTCQKAVDYYNSAHSINNSKGKDVNLSGVNLSFSPIQFNQSGVINGEGQR